MCGVFNPHQLMVATTLHVGLAVNLNPASVSWNGSYVTHLQNIKAHTGILGYLKILASPIQPASISIDGLALNFLPPKSISL